MITPQDISIIIPVYNVEKYLSECLDSILVTNCFTGEVICINDGSTDNSNNILEQYAQRYPNIKHLSQQNQGIGATRNNGLDIATGKYIFFIDSDDTIAPHAIETLCKSVDDEDIVYFDVQHRNEDNTKVLYNRKTTPVSRVAGVEYFEKYYNDVITVWSGIYKRDFLVIHNLTFLPGAYYEDVLFNMQAFCYAQNISTLQNILYYYRCNNTSITSHVTNKHIDSRLRINEALFDFIKKNDWITPKTKQFILNEYNCLFNQIIELNYTHLKKIPKKHYSILINCCRNTLQDTRTIQIAQFSIRKAYQYHNYLLPKWERKIINFLLGLKTSSE